MKFAERDGSNFCLPTESAPKHKWYTFPFMEKEECLLFYVFNQELEGPRFTFHTAFEDPHTPDDAPDRESIEIRTICCFDDPPVKPTFFDMIHSNNAARARLWIKLKGLGFLIDTKMITYPDL